MASRGLRLKLTVSKAELDVAEAGPEGNGTSAPTVEEGGGAVPMVIDKCAAAAPADQTPPALAHEEGGDAAAMVDDEPVVAPQELFEASTGSGPGILSPKESTVAEPAVASGAALSTESASTRVVNLVGEGIDIGGKVEVRVHMGTSMWTLEVRSRLLAHTSADVPMPIACQPALPVEGVSWVVNVGLVSYENKVFYWWRIKGWITPAGLRVPSTNTFAFLIVPAASVAADYQDIMGEFLSTMIPGSIVGQVHGIAAHTAQAVLCNDPTGLLRGCPITLSFILAHVACPALRQFSTTRNAGVVVSIADVKLPIDHGVTPPPPDFDPSAEPLSIVYGPGFALTVLDPRFHPV
ncbi:hypothetical protein PENSPDRAFT_661464 [Peniophora sp. CONT]|nr:hypothetical protein PENSPDRAFT_661464 [Peniophora sp. CONT]